MPPYPAGSIFLFSRSIPFGHGYLLKKTAVKPIEEVRRVFVTTVVKPFAALPDPLKKMIPCTHTSRFLNNLENTNCVIGRFFSARKDIFVLKTSWLTDPRSSDRGVS
jgi:hypothetical protein